MTKKLSVLSIVVVLLLSVCLVGCGSDNGDSAASASTKETTPIEALSLNEKSVYNAVLDANFFNQKEARVLEVVDSNNVIFVGVQGTNKVGGTISKWYYIKNDNLAEYGDYEKKSDEDFQIAAGLSKLSSNALDKMTLGEYDELQQKSKSYVVTHYPDDSVKRINDALKYNWETKGI